MTSADLFQQRVNECRRFASTARNRSDKAFWLGLAERWQALKSRNASRPPAALLALPTRRTISGGHSSLSDELAEGVARAAQRGLSLPKRQVPPQPTRPPQGHKRNASLTASAVASRPSVARCVHK